MFSQKKKKGKVEITNISPRFSVRYVGRTEVFTAAGTGCTARPVQRIWDGSVEERDMPRCTLVVSANGILLAFENDEEFNKANVVNMNTHTSSSSSKNGSKKNGLKQKTKDSEKDKKLSSLHPRQILFDIHDISYCCADNGPHDRVFAWICKNSTARKLECHAVVCGAPDKAQGIAVCLSRAFQIAYRDWKTQKEKLARMKQNGLAGEGDDENSGFSRQMSRNSQQSHSSKSSEDERGSEEDMKERGFDGNSYSTRLSAEEQEELNAALAQMNFVEEEEMNVEELKLK